NSKEIKGKYTFIYVGQRGRLKLDNNSQVW
ncbi:unnamed protein product, partial [marine sediment metagenome]